LGDEFGARINMILALLANEPREPLLRAIQKALDDINNAESIIRTATGSIGVARWAPLR
jgi:hypothetical protein